MNWLFGLFLSVGVAAADAGLDLAVVDVRVFTGAADGGVIEHATVLIADGRVAAVGPTAEVVVPAGCSVVDGRGRTLLPGLLDAHVHLFGSAGRFDRPIELDATLRAEQTLACGVIGVLDLNGPEDAVLALRGVAREPAALLPRIFSVGAAVSVAGGHGTEGGFAAHRLSGTDDVAEVIEQLRRRGVDFVKAMDDPGGWGSEPERPTLSQAQLNEIVAAAHRAGLRTVVHCVDVAHMKDALRAGADAIAHGPIVGEVDAELIELFRARGATLIATLAVYRALADLADDDATWLDRPLVRRFVDPRVVALLRDPAWRRDPHTVAQARYFTERLPQARAAVAALHAAGVRVIAGTDAGNPGTFHGEAMHRELAELVAAGLSERDALLAATRDAARFLGVDAELGVLPGRVADLLLVNGNPLHDIAATRAIELVLRRGVPVSRDGIAARTAALAAAPAADKAASFARTLFDFEREDGALPQHTVVADQGDSEVRADCALEPDSGDRSRFLRLRGDVKLAPPSGGYAGVLFALRGADEPPFDASGYRAIRFRARAADRAPFRLQVRSESVRDGDEFGALFVATPNWSWYEIPLAELSQIGFGRRARFDAGRLTGIGFLTGVGFEGPFQLDVDDIALLPR